MPHIEIISCPVRAEYLWEDIPLLQAQARLPHWEGAGGKRFNHYYRGCERVFERWCSEDLFPRAQSLCRQAMAVAGTLPQWSAELRPAVTLQTAEIYSLYIDTIETAGPRRTVIRQGDIWDLRRGLPLSPQDLFPPRSPWRRRLMDCAAQEIESRLERGEGVFREHWRRALRSALHSRHFYLTENGLCFFCQMYTLSPSAAKIPTFCLPYDKEQGPFPFPPPET